jgi:hypothetical protein
VELQIKKKKEEEAKVSFAKKACGLLGKLIMGAIILMIISPMLTNLYKSMTADRTVGMN